MHTDDSELIRERVLVTGASGFIGSHLCRRLLQAGAEVHGVSRKPAPEAHNGIRWWQDDLSDLERLEALMARLKPSIVFHLAAEVSGTRDIASVPRMLQSNLVAGVNLMLAATKQACRRVVLAGSLEEADSLSDVPVSPYAAAKGAAGQFARMLHSLYGTPVVNARLFMVYGPGQTDLTKLVPYSILAYLRGSSPSILSPDRAVDWVYVDDAVDGLLACAMAPDLEGGALDIGSGRMHTVREVVETIGEEMGASRAPVFGAQHVSHAERVRVADVAETYRRTGWQPVTDLHVGLARTIAWYEDAVDAGTLTPG